jgi:phosphoglycerate dehydrogenase-like enzyme
MRKTRPSVRCDDAMQIGLIGLGRMGANVARRLARRRQKKKS